VVSHDHAARVTRETLRRFRGNARTTFEHRLARGVGIREHCRVDVYDDLVALAGSAGIHTVVQRGFCEQRQRVGLQLSERRRVL
jgi:hypothetical protein